MKERDRVYYLFGELKPMSPNGRAKGAFMTMWIRALTRESAIKRARKVVRQERWILKGIESCVMARPERMNRVLKRRYQLALKRGHFWMTFSWTGKVKEPAEKFQRRKKK